MNIDRHIFLRRPFAFSGGDSGRCYSLPINPQVSANQAPCCFAPTHTNDPCDRTDHHTSVQPNTREHTHAG